MSARWLPKGFHTITPNIVVDDAEQAVAFFKKAFGASESYRLTMSDGRWTAPPMAWVNSPAYSLKRCPPIEAM